jgi:hypothetical protein
MTFKLLPPDLIRGSWPGWLQKTWTTFWFKRRRFLIPHKVIG